MLGIHVMEMKATESGEPNSGLSGEHCEIPIVSSRIIPPTIGLDDDHFELSHSLSELLVLYFNNYLN